VLVHPQQGERRPGRCSVRARHCDTNTLEQASAAPAVANVRRRYDTGVDEGMTKRDVPRPQRVNLAVEVLATPRKRDVAVGHASERGERSANQRVDLRRGKLISPNRSDDGLVLRERAPILRTLLDEVSRFRGFEVSRGGGRVAMSRRFGAASRRRGRAAR
jgi:hypothetical protein